MAKGKHTGLKVFLIIILLIVVLPVGLTFALFYDPSSKSIDVKAQNTDEMINGLVVKSLDNTKDTGKMDLSLTCDDFNGVIKQVFEKDELKTIKEYLPQAYIENESGTNKYNITAEVQFKFFKSKITLATELKDDGESFVFEVTDIKVGRLSNVDDIALKIVEKTGSSLTDIDDKISTAIGKVGLKMECDLANKKLTYNKKQFIKDIRGLLPTGESDDAKLFPLLLEEFSESGMVGFDFKDDISAIIDLSQITTNDYKTDDKDLALSTKINNFVAKMETASGTILKKDDYQNVYDFMFHGYDNIKSEQQVYIDNIQDIDTFVGGDHTLYEGLEIHNNVDIAEQMRNDFVNNFAANFTSNHQICQISETTINEALQNKQILGTKYLLTAKENDATNINYITVDNFYCNLINDADNANIAAFIIGLNFNGYETVLCLKTTLLNAGVGTIKFQFNDNSLYIGNKVMNAELSDYFYRLIDKSLDGDSTIRFDLENKTLTFGFENLITDINNNAIIQAYRLTNPTSGIVTVLKDATLQEEGAIILKMDM